MHKPLAEQPDQVKVLVRQLAAIDRQHAAIQASADEANIILVRAMNDDGDEDSIPEALFDLVDDVWACEQMVAELRFQTRKRMIALAHLIGPADARSLTNAVIWT